MFLDLISVAQDEKISLLKKVLHEITYMEIQVSGSSMEPYLFDGETVIISEVQELLKSGDVILFRNEQYKLGLHRVLEVKSSNLLIKGDNSKIEELINRELVIGKMISKSENFNWHFEKVNKTVVSENDSLPMRIEIANSRLLSIQIGFY